MEELKAFLKTRAVVNLSIVTVNIAVFLVMSLFGNVQSSTYMIAHGAYYLPLIQENGEYYRLLTSMFLHFGIQHLFGNMLCLIFLGDMLEKLAGKGSYLLIYFGGGIGSGLVTIFYELGTGSRAVCAGASGAIFSVIGALVFLSVIHRGEIPNFGRKRFYIMTALMIYQGFTSQSVNNAAHVGGFVCGFLLAAIFIGKRKLKELPELFAGPY